MKKPLPAPVLASVAVTFVVLGSVLFFSRPVQDWLFARPYAKIAVGQAKWGMSPSQVETAQGVKLDTPTNKNRYHTPAQGLEDRYKVLKQDDYAFSGRSADIHYVFFDDKLYAFHLTLRGRDPQELENVVLAHLLERFGKVHSRIDDGTPLRGIWHLREVIVNYWLVKNPLSLTSPFEAVFGVVYQPIERSIPSA